MSAFASCLYFGEVVHQRVFPRRHRLRYRIFQGLFDLDELPRLGGKLRLFSYNRANLFAFHDADHGDGGTLRAYVENLVTRAGLCIGGGRIAVLCMPRIMGFVFNPLSVFYCYNSEDDLVAIVYEVNNTFGQRHTYVIPVESSTSDGVRQRCEKAFYVSPFMEMDMNYDFKLTLPGATLSTNINGNDREGAPLILASFTGTRHELSDGMLLSALLTYPLLTVGVVAAIHWEALKLFGKGLRLRRRPSLPPADVTIVRSPYATPKGASQAEAVDYLHKMDKQSV